MGKTQLCIVCNEYIGLLGWGKHVQRHQRELGSDIYNEVKKRKGLPERKPKIKKISVRAVKSRIRVLVNHSLGEYLG